MPSIIQSFTGKYAFLSPLFRSAFFFDNDQYNSPAAAFEAAKILSRPDRVSFIGWNMQPWNARRLGKNIPKNWMRPDWDAAQLDIMLEIQRSKFSWPILREMLLATEDAQLVHGNACHDNFWGVCECQSLPAGKQKYGVSHVVPARRQPARAHPHAGTPRGPSRPAPHPFGSEVRPRG